MRLLLGGTIERERYLMLPLCGRTCFKWKCGTHCFSLFRILRVLLVLGVLWVFRELGVFGVLGVLGVLEALGVLGVRARKARSTSIVALMALGRYMWSDFMAAVCSGRLCLIKNVQCAIPAIVHGSSIV
jgi:hypothetical protein